MNAALLPALAPLAILGLGTVLLMAQVAARRNALTSPWLSAAVLALALGAAAAGWPRDAVAATPLLAVDAYARLFSVLIIGAALVTVLISGPWLAPLGSEQHEYYLLLLLATFGAVVLVHATHIASLMLGMETLSVALYALIAYPDKTWLPIEAGLKYLVLSSAATAIMLFGFALLYAAVGELGFAALGARLAHGDPMLLGAAALMVIAGLAFKLSLVPFHMWTPDVYQGAPIPIAGYLATVSKVAIFAALLRWYQVSGLARHAAIVDILTLLAVASMLVGNLLALRQANVRRLLGYSSIAHMGYLLVPLVVYGHTAQPQLALEAASCYVVTYAVSNLAAFVALAALYGTGGADPACDVEHLAGLFWRQPLIALLLCTALLSLAGIPLTAGFVGKFYIVAAGAEVQLWVPLAALLIGSAIGLYYYLRVVYAMTAAAPAPQPSIPGAAIGARTLCVALVALVFYLGMYPQPLIAALRGMF